MQTIVFKVNRLESALAMSKISFLRKFEKSYTYKKKFSGQRKKIRVYLLLTKNRKKMISFKSATSTTNLSWNDPYIVYSWFCSEDFVVQTDCRLCDPTTLLQYGNACVLPCPQRYVIWYSFTSFPLKVTGAVHLFIRQYQNKTLLTRTAQKK